jgi:hypothetical protein
VIRAYNPFGEAYRLSTPTSAVTPFGDAQEPVEQVAPDAVAHLAYQTLAVAGRVERADLRFVDFPQWPVGASHTVIDPAVLRKLREQIGAYQREQAEIQERLAGMSEERDALQYHRAKHADVRLEREILELKLLRAAE